jgi:hypothetical protein
MKKIIIVGLAFANVMYSQGDKSAEVNEPTWIAKMVLQIDAFNGQGLEEQAIWNLAIDEYSKRYNGKAPDSIYYDRMFRVYGLEYQFKDSIVVIEVEKSIIEYKLKL